MRTLSLLQQARGPRRSRYGTITSRTLRRSLAAARHRSAGIDPGAHRDPRAAPGSSAQAAADQPAQRLSPHRYRCLHAARRDRILRPARRTPSYATAELTWGLRACVHAPDSRADVIAISRPLADRRRQSLRGKTARHLRLWPYRRGRCRLRQGIRHECLVWAREASLAARTRGWLTRPRRNKDEFFARLQRHFAAHALADAHARYSVTAADLAAHEANWRS